MPTIPQQQTIVQYLANSSQTQYTFAFYAPMPTDIQVYLQAPNALPIPSADILVLNVDYTVTYNVDPTTGGFITLLAAPTTGWYLTINRQVVASLTTNFYLAQNINGADLDTAFDRLLLLCQQNLNYNLERNLSYVINTYLPNAMPYTQLPPLPQNNVWIGSGSGVVAAQLAVSPSASVLQSMLANNALGTDGARLVGYYDAIHSNPTTVQAYLAGLLNQPTINQPNIVGVSDGSSAAAGSVGEVISSVIAFTGAVAVTTNTETDITHINLTPGQWVISGSVFIICTSNVITSLAAWANIISATVPASGIYSALSVGSATIGQWGGEVNSLPLNITTPTTVYLSCNALFGSGTTSAWGAIYATRVR